MRQETCTSDFEENGVPPDRHRLRTSNIFDRPLAPARDRSISAILITSSRTVQQPIRQQYAFLTIGYDSNCVIHMRYGARVSWVLVGGLSPFTWTHSHASDERVVLESAKISCTVLSLSIIKKIGQCQGIKAVPLSVASCNLDLVLDDARLALVKRVST